MSCHGRFFGLFASCYYITFAYTRILITIPAITYNPTKLPITPSAQPIIAPTIGIQPTIRVARPITAPAKIAATR